MTGTVTRWWHIVQVAWEEDRASAPTRHQYDEPAFLPAALEIIETPPNPLGRTLLLALCAMVVAALAWSILGHVDVVVVAPGKTLPREHVQIVSWSGPGSGLEGATGVVRALHVADGDRVRKGQLLIELDPTISGADTAQAQRGLLSAEADAARSRALVNYLDHGVIDVQVPPGLSSDEAGRLQALVRSTIEEYEARIAGLRQARAEHVADLASAETERTKLGEMLVPLDKELAMRTELAAKGYQSKVALYQLEQVRIERVKNMELQVSAAAKARAAIAGIDAQLREARQVFARGGLTDLAKAGDDSSVRRDEIVKAAHRTALLQIRAPVDGTVEQLQVHTVGGTVEPAQPLLTIVPLDDALVAEAQVENRDIGFVRVGQPVAIKVEAFPFTEYGVLQGTVTSVGRDGVAMPNAGDPTGVAAAPAKSLGFVVRIRLRKSFVMVGDCDRARTASPYCRPTALSPGMALAAEIRTGRRRIIDYALSPLMKASTEAGRER